MSIKAGGADIQHWGHKAYAQKKLQAASQQAAGLLAVSKALKQDMVDIGLPEGKITVHYTGLDRDLFRPLDQEKCRQQLADDFNLHLDEGQRLLVTVGALIPRKGQHFVIRALAQLPDRHLALVGMGADRPALEKLVHELGLANRVHFLGSLDHGALPVVLSAADVMVLPASSEGLANAWVEALACGTPLVIADAGGAKELVTTSAAGRVIARNSDAIVAGVREVLAAHYAPEEVAKSAERFSWEANAARLASRYEQLIA